MSFTINGTSIFEIIIVTFLASCILVPLSIRIAKHVGAIDMPNERKVHTKPMPRLGGLAIFLSFLIGYMLYAPKTIQMLSILIASFIIILVGIFDDINPLRARTKFCVQVIAALIVVFYGNIVLNDISILGFTIHFIAPINYFVTVLFICAITNAINLIDGLDGLASGISTIYFITVSIIALLIADTAGLDGTLALIMVGSTLGFLIYNFPPAKTFMGDTGSQFLGFMISVISLLGFKTATFTSLIVPIVILAIPIFDTILAIFRRILKGESIGTPDREHFHHQLLKMKFGQRRSVLIIYGINILFAAVSIFYALGDNKIAIIIYLVLMVLLLITVLKTDILFDHHKEKSNVKKTKKSV